MHDDDKSNSHGSATTSATSRAAPDKGREPDFLAEQSAEAQAALADTLNRIQATLKDTADLEQWAREYPWASVGVAAAFGFITAAAITPSGHDPRKEWMEMVREALREGYIPTEPPGQEPKESGSAVGSAFSSLLKTFGDALQSSIVAAVTAKATAEPSPNGHHDE